MRTRERLLFALMFLILAGFSVKLALGQDADRSNALDMVLVPRAKMIEYQDAMAHMQREREEALEKWQGLQSSTQCLAWKTGYL